MSDIHVLPCADRFPHLDLRQCPCRPYVEVHPSDMALVVHQAWDGREYAEPEYNRIFGTAGQLGLEAKPS